MMNTACFKFLKSPRSLRLRSSLFTALLSCCFTSAYAINVNYDPQVRSYVHNLCDIYHFDQAELTSIFSQINFNAKIIARFQRLTRPPAKPPLVPLGPPLPPVHIYSKKDIAELVQPGAKFMRENAIALAQAEQSYGIPASVITAIFGLETDYGNNIGHYLAIESLATYAFYSPRNRDYFRKELTEFLLLCRDEGWPVFKVKSSIDGGLGMPQFMPSSYRRFAVDVDHTGRSNLFTNKQDAIASIANYLHKAGWNKGQLIAVRGKIKNQAYKKLLSESGKPHLSLDQLKQNGVLPLIPLPSHLPVGVVFFHTPHGIEAWITLPNFWAIRTYNQYPPYDIAVAELSSKIIRAMHHSMPSSSHGGKHEKPKKAR